MSYTGINCETVEDVADLVMNGTDSERDDESSRSSAGEMKDTTPKGWPQGKEKSPRKRQPRISNYFSPLNGSNQNQSSSTRVSSGERVAYSEEDRENQQEIGEIGETARRREETEEAEIDGPEILPRTPKSTGTVTPGDHRSPRKVATSLATMQICGATSSEYFHPSPKAPATNSTSSPRGKNFKSAVAADYKTPEKNGVFSKATSSGATPSKSSKRPIDARRCDGETAPKTPRKTDATSSGATSSASRPELNAMSPRSQRKKLTPSDTVSDVKALWAICNSKSPKSVIAPWKANATSSDATTSSAPKQSPQKSAGISTLQSEESLPEKVATSSAAKAATAQSASLDLNLTTPESSPEKVATSSSAAAATVQSASSDLNLTSPESSTPKTLPQRKMPPRSAKTHGDVATPSTSNSRPPKRTAKADVTISQQKRQRNEQEPTSSGLVAVRKAVKKLQKGADSLPEWKKEYEVEDSADETLSAYEEGDYNTDDDMDLDDDSRREENLLKVPTILVVHPGLKNKKDKSKQEFQFNQRIKVVHKFTARIPKRCSEARKANDSGSWRRKPVKEENKLLWPGIPNGKFDTRDQRADWDENTEWNVQAIFEMPERPGYAKILYEGWSSSTMSTQEVSDFAETCSKMIAEGKIRDQFVEKMREFAEVKARKTMEKKAADGEVITFEEAMKLHFVKPARDSNTHSLFWLYQDLDYFHSKHQEEQLLGPIWYMSMRCSRPPKYAYTPINIVRYDAFEYLKNHDSSLTCKQLVKKRNVRGEFSRVTDGVCENPKGCKCHARFELLYGDAAPDLRWPTVKLIEQLPNGSLDLTGFCVADARIVVECSDECGCSYKCPRRRLQLGQKKPMVVFNEGEKGFGLRAAQAFSAGELVCEYTGKMFLLDENDVDKEEPYEHAISTQLKLQKRQTKSSFKREKQEKRRKEREERENEKKLTKNGENTSYQAGFCAMDKRIVICAKKVGNIARFINHCCDPNTAFFEVDSRRYSTDPSIPRVAVFALKDIAFGEEITIAYWDPNGDFVKGSEKSLIKCRCGSSNCMVYLPC